MTKQQKEPYFYPEKIQVVISLMSTSLAILGQTNSVCKYHVWQTEVLLSFLLSSNSAQLWDSDLPMASHCYGPAGISAHIDN